MQLKEYKLGDIAEIVNGSTPSTSCSHYYDGDIVWITPKDLSEQKSKYYSSPIVLFLIRYSSRCLTQILSV